MKKFRTTCELNESQSQDTNENVLMFWLLNKTNWTNHRCNEIVQGLSKVDNLQIQDLSAHGLQIDEIQEITTLLQREQAVIHIKQITQESTNEEQRMAINNLFLEIVDEADGGIIDSFHSWSSVYTQIQLPEGYTTLEQIYIYSRGLTGNIPSLFGYIPNLIRLAIFRNQLSGVIPSTIGNLTNLTFLNLYNNQLTGEIPSSLGNLTNLTDLYLSYNQLSGEIPSSLGNLTNLTQLYLSNNQLSGEIPSSLGNLINLTYLSLSYNYLSGEIPTSMENLINITCLYISNNRLSGNIPSTFRNLTKFDLRNNPLNDCVLNSYGTRLNV